MPDGGTYRIGFFSERASTRTRNASYMDQDIDRNGNPTGDDGLFAVLWDERANDVWVDTDRDLDFSDEKAMTDYARRPEFGVFGKDDPATPWRDTVAFAVQTDRKNKFVSINVAIYQHATTIMGSVVGNREPAAGSRESLPARASSRCSTASATRTALIEGLIAAFGIPRWTSSCSSSPSRSRRSPYLLADAHASDQRRRAAPDGAYKKLHVRAGRQHARRSGSSRRTASRPER